MGQLNLYVVNPDHQFPRKFLSDEVYAEAIESLIIVCTDILPISRERGTVYLAPRKAKPMAGLWWIGGRVNLGELEYDAAKRNFRRETSLDLDPQRFKFVHMNRLICDEREQEPQNKGMDYLIYAFAVNLSEEEVAVASANLEKKEYQPGVGLREFSREQLVQEGIHRSILDLYDAVFK